MTAFTLQLISLALFIIGASLTFPPLVAPRILGRAPSDWQRRIAWMGRMLISVSILFSLVAFVVSKVAP